MNGRKARAIRRLAEKQTVGMPPRRIMMKRVIVKSVQVWGQLFEVGSTRALYQQMKKVYRRLPWNERGSDANAA